jgi:hypothetical protein
MQHRSFVLSLLLTALIVPASARRAAGQYTMDRHPASAADSTGDRVLRTLREDLSRLRLLQDSFYVVNKRYSADTAALFGWKPTSGARILITSADSTGWSVLAAHPSLVGSEMLAIRRTPPAGARR